MIDFLHYDYSRKTTGVAPYTLLLLGFVPALGGATPIGHVRRGSNDGSGKVKTQVWVPIVVVSVVLAMFIAFWSRKRLKTTLTRMGEAAAIATGAITHHDMVPAGQESATREVTAEQLAGRTSNTTQARRPRRTRRTPSQISTASLPLYMKEPGDQELVIYRGQDPEDNPDIAIVMPAVLEDGEGHSRDASRLSLYGNVPESPQNMSLIQGDESLDLANDTSTRHLLPLNSGNTPLRGSFDTTHGSEESSSSLLQAVQIAGHDPRGEAPPYFEVVDSDNNDGPRQSMSSPATESTSTAPSDSPRSATVGSRPNHDPQTRENHNSNRLSGFRNFLHTFTSPNARPSTPQESFQNSHGHTRADSTMSATSSTTHESRLPPTRERVTSRASHRPSHSGSGTGIHSVFRTISRQRSQNTLNSAHFNSPSMISLNSISAPLTHTLTRTEISYPASGPTAEQMRLISSRESFARFAVPYGPDAIAFAASTSRHDLEPTPDYELAPGAATAARSSPLVPAAPSVDAAQPSSDSSSSRSLPSDDTEAPQNAETGSEEPLASPVKEAHSTMIPSLVIDAKPPPSPVQAPPASDPVSRDAAVEAAPATLSLSPPPSTSFKVVPPPPRMRSESRASSLMSTTSFATAEESLYASALSGTDSPDSPSTPHTTSFHPHDITDTTISHGMIPVTV